MNALTPTSTTAPAIGTGLIPRSMQEAMSLAQMMSQGKMMPDHLKTPGDALMVIEQAMRWNMSPFAVAQSTFNIKGKLLFAGTIVAAAIENSGAIVGHLDYKFDGEGQSRRVTVIGHRRGEAEPRTVEVALKDAKTGNDIWVKQPDQQLVYHGARVWARRWTPGVMLGVYTPEEWHQQPDNFTGPTIESRAEPVRQPPRQPPRAVVPDLDDSIPALDDAPMYPLVTREGTRYAVDGDDLIATWAKTIKRMQTADAISRLPAFADLNRAALAGIEAHDAATVSQIRDMIAAAMEPTAPAADDGFPGEVTPREVV